MTRQPQEITRPDIPVFKLYGESRAWHTPDLIHCESISERSEMHQWHIAPHRHNGLVQLVYLSAGTATVELEGKTHQLQRPTLLFLPEMCVHGFDFSRDAEGRVITIAAPLLKQLSERHDFLMSATGEAGVFPLTSLDGPVNSILETIAEEYINPAPGRALVLESLVGVLLVWLRRRQARDALPEPGSRQDRGGHHLLQFSRLVENHYKAHHPIEFYGGQLGITAAHLNTLCRRLAGHSALQIVHERLLLEAKRNLIYTSMTISQVSDTLGFSEPAYFTRFFKRLTGSSPKAFREEFHVAG